jgi:hypothetical protein
MGAFELNRADTKFVCDPIMVDTSPGGEAISCEITNNTFGIPWGVTLRILLLLKSEMKRLPVC